VELAGMWVSLGFDTTSRFAQRHLNRRSLGKSLPGENRRLSECLNV